ncbi:MAG: FAD-dependent oxidoreductase, partial [Hyphomonadaceae bacterium]|nr:FAD-dependent oxidoreductase [Hyphomonadaceae bacterium]
MTLQNRSDVIVAGGGMVGLTLALALQQAGLRVVVVDAAPPAMTLAPAHDGRASAIAFASWRMLRALGVAQRIGAHAQPIEEILITDGRPANAARGGGPSSLFLHFDRRELDARAEGEALGYMVENRRLRL